MRGLRFAVAVRSKIDPPEDMTDDQFQGYFSPLYLLYIMHQVTDELLNSDHTVAHRRQILRALSVLMNLIGPSNLAAIRIKVLAVLDLSLQCEELTDAALEAWKNFLHHVDPASLGPMLAQVTATLLAVLSRSEVAVLEMLEFMYVEKRALLQDHFKEIFFLPDSPQLARINDVLRASGDQAPPLDRRLQQVMQSLLHENLQVRTYAAKELHRLLRAHRATITAMVLEQETPEPIVAQLVATVFEALRHSDEQLQVLLGECLGELGAVDPGRIGAAPRCDMEPSGRRGAAPGRPDSLQILMEQPVLEPGVGMALIGTHLVNAFLSATSTRFQDFSAYAIQECLKHYGCQPDFPRDGDFRVAQLEALRPGQQIWQSLSQEVRNIIHPYLDSKLERAPMRQNSGVPKPFFRQPRMCHFHDWIQCWTGDMILELEKHASSEADMQACSIFKACRLVFKQHIDTALFLTPHLVMALMFAGKQDVLHDILLEITAVLNSPDANASMRQLATHTVFSIVDHANQWFKCARRELIAKRGTAQDRVLIKDRYGLVHSFLKDIKDDELARAADACHDYARALLHFELHLQKKTQTEPLSSEDLDFLQKIYSRLGPDVDGMAGVSAIRKQDSSLDAQLLDHRTAGRWTQALSCYERALQTGSAQLEHHIGLLECQMNLGHLETTLTHATGILSRHPSWTEVNRYRVEAAWKLCDWDSLDRYLAAAPAPALPLGPLPRNGPAPAPAGSLGADAAVGAMSPDFHSCLGRMIQAAWHHQLDDLLRLHEQAVREAMVHVTTLSKAASYERAYGHILRLHMLHELKQGLVPLLQVINFLTNEKKKKKKKKKKKIKKKKKK